MGALFLVSFGFAQDGRDPKDGKGVINNRKERQDERIDRGKADGSLTKAEAAKLKAKQVQVNKDIREARSDGKVTAKEKAKITKEQNKLSKEIKDQRTDKQTRK